MVDLLVEEATHDGDFAEHLNMHRSRTFHGKEKNAFVHWYEKRPVKKKDYDPEDSADTFHGIMAYHGYKQKKAKTPTSIEYSGEDKHKEHRFKAQLNSHGHVVGVHHHERFKDVNEDTKPKVFGKKLRDVITRKTPVANTVLDTPTAPSQKKATDDFIKATNDGGSDYPDRNGNPDGFATDKSPKRKSEGVAAGYKEPMKSIKEEQIDEDGINHHYHIVDTHTKAVVGKAKTLGSAHRASDKRNNAYGAHRYSPRRVEGPHPSAIKNEGVELDERETSHPVEYYDAKNRERKRDWHYKRVGKNKNASFKAGIKNDYEAELLKRGVKDSNGNQTPLRKEDVDQIDELTGKGKLDDIRNLHFDKAMSTPFKDPDFDENHRKFDRAAALVRQRDATKDLKAAKAEAKDTRPKRKKLREMLGKD